MVVKVKSNAPLLCTWHYQPQYHRALELCCYAPLAKPQSVGQIEVKVQGELQLEFGLKQCSCQLQLTR